MLGTSSAARLTAPCRAAGDVGAGRLRVRLRLPQARDDGPRHPVRADKYVHIGTPPTTRTAASRPASSSSSPTRPCSGRPVQRPLADLSVVRPSAGRPRIVHGVALNCTAGRPRRPSSGSRSADPAPGIKVRVLRRSTARRPAAHRERVCSRRILRALERIVQAHATRLT